MDRDKEFKLESLRLLIERQKEIIRRKKNNPGSNEEDIEKEEAILKNLEEQYEIFSNPDVKF